MKSSTRRQYEASVLRVQRRVEASLDELPAPEELARVAGLSLQHFHRVFRGMTGESVMGMARRLRLERAARRLRASSSTVLEVALEAGYGSHEAFTRAFVAAFGIAPTQYRCQPTRLTSRSCSPLGPRTSVTVEAFPTRSVALMRSVGDYAAVGSTWQRLMGWASRRGASLGLLPPKMYGRAHDDPDITDANRLRYDACLMLPDDSAWQGDEAAGVARGVLEEGRYASVIHRGPYDTLAASYLDLIGRWFPESSHVPAAGPAVERYLDDPSSTPPDQLRTQISVRIDERGWVSSS